MKKTIFYGSLYDDEMSNYKRKIEEQFRDCVEKAKKDDMEIVTWGFDVLVRDSLKKTIAESFVEDCAKKYFPGIKNVSLMNK